MTAEEIKRIVDGERAEQLTVQLCRHWEIATRRLEELAQDMSSGLDTCVEAEIYAALMRMQNTSMALFELSKNPAAFLFSEYFDRIGQVVSNVSIRQSVMALLQHLMTAEETGEPQSSLFQLVTQFLSKHYRMPAEQQESERQEAFVKQQLLTFCAQYLRQDDLMMVLSVLQQINTEANEDNRHEANDLIMQMRQSMEELGGKMKELLQPMAIGLLMLMLLPDLMLNILRQQRADSTKMGSLFDKVQAHVREGKAWKSYWKNRRETMRVVSDSSSWKEILMAERSKERAELGQVPGGLFAKWATDRKAFDIEFQKVGLSDEALRHFIFHLASLEEIGTELAPKAKSGSEQSVRNAKSEVEEAVMTAARKLSDLVTNAWFPQYDAMWQELIQDGKIFDSLKVKRKSPHNNLFTARFFCHLVGEMKKSAVFGGHSDRKLASKLTDKYSIDTYRKNIQEGMGDEPKYLQDIFYTIYQKYRKLTSGQ
ncbi:MAG: hypothetical protein IJ628_00750 [Bacteroidaceae bacterium]|nr:hypothetical protein [Bacteroidaceae bacterium]